MGLPLDNPDFALLGKIRVKEEGVEKVAQGIGIPWCGKAHKVWKANLKRDNRIIQRSSIPWNRVDYKVELLEDLIDIPIDCIDEGDLVDLCMQRSAERGSGCDAPAEIPGRPTSSDGAWESSEGLHTPVTPSLRPPKTRKRQYSWRKSSKKEICRRIRIFNPLEFRILRGKELTRKNKESANYREAESTFLGTTDDDGMVTSPNSDVTIQEAVWNADENRLVARKRFVPRKRLLPYSVKSFKESLKASSKIVTFIALYLAILTNVLGGLINIKRYERKSTVGTLTSLPRSESSRDYSCYYSFSILRKFLANILSFNKELWPNVIIDAYWKENKRLKRWKGI